MTIPVLADADARHWSELSAPEQLAVALEEALEQYYAAHPRCSLCAGTGSVEDAGMAVVPCPSCNGSGRRAA